ncbi:MAG TPA: replicative DNA helicase [Bacteroidales bacterium]|nr:replicative DNA helicase [Bacteroidales bacterium]
MTKPQLQYIPDFGKIPPQSVDIEQLVLGSILATPESFDEVAIILKEEAFYKATHQIIYRQIVENAKSNKPVDVFSVMDAMRESGTLEDVGGAVYLTDLTSKIVSSASIAHHASIVKEKYIRREVIRIASKASGLAFEESADEVVNYLESALFELTGENMISEPRQLFEIYEELSDYLEKLSRREIKLTGVPAGILPLDRITLGWQPSDLIIIAARPSVGKTALALQLTRSAALLGKKVLFFSLEMSERQLATRLLSGATEIDSQQLRRAHDLPWEKIHETILENYNKNIFIDDKSGQSVFTMRSTIRKYKRKYNIDLVVIDYLQLAQGDERFIKFLPKYYGSIATTLKNTAKDVDIPIILLSQLNRAVEDRSSHIPKLSDLKESGDIEQDADVVLFPLRYIQFKEFHDDPKYGNIQDKGQIDIAKHRNGPTGRVYVSISDDVTRWTEWDRDFKINTQ